jgi:hypothetical protein
MSDEKGKAIANGKKAAKVDEKVDTVEPMRCDSQVVS